MIYHFQIISQECKDFRLEIKLSNQNTFFDFHSIIQKSLGYESHQLASFFISDRKGMKEKRERKKVRQRERAEEMANLQNVAFGIELMSDKGENAN